MQVITDGYALLQIMKKYCVLTKEFGRLKLTEKAELGEMPGWIKEILEIIQQSYFLDVEDHPYMHMLLVVHLKTILQKEMVGMTIIFEAVLHFYSLLTLSEAYLSQVEEFLNLPAPNNIKRDRLMKWNCLREWIT